MLPEIEQSVLHVFTTYRENDRLLSALALFFNEYKEELVKHIRREENEFFPYVEKLLHASRGIHTESVSEKIMKHSSLEHFLLTHDNVEEKLDEVRDIIRRHSPEGPLPFPYRIFLTQVDIFAMELKKHGVIEDHLFVPMVLKLEAGLIGRY